MVSIPWKNIIIGGLGGGAIEEAVEKLATTYLPATMQVAGMNIAQIVTIVGSAYGAQKTKGMVSTALEASAVIGVYKLVYPMFISPLLASFGIVTGSPPGYHKVTAPAQTQINDLYIGGAY